MYEHRRMRPLSRQAFRARLLRHFMLALGIVAVALFLGVAGYHFLGGLSWIDALVNASMILGGMGPVDPMTSVPAKVFASLYALFSGLAFIGIAAVLFAPFLHRLLHRFHWEEVIDEDDSSRGAGRNRRISPE